MRPERALDGGYARMLHFKGGSHACLIPTRVAMHGASPRASTQNRALFCFRLPANRYPCTLRCATDAASPWTTSYRGPPRQRPERAGNFRSLCCSRLIIGGLAWPTLRGEPNPRPTRRNIAIILYREGMHWSWSMCAARAPVLVRATVSGRRENATTAVKSPTG